METGQLISAYGPSGVVLALGLAFLRLVLPWIKEYLTAQTEQMKRIADAMVELKNQQLLFGQQLGEVRADIGDVQLDIARIYEIGRQEPPSRGRRSTALVRGS